MWCINLGGSVIRWFLLKTSISLSLNRYQDAGNNDLSLGGPPLLAFIREAFWKKRVSKWLTLTKKDSLILKAKTRYKNIIFEIYLLVSEPHSQQPYVWIYSGLLSVNFHETRFQREYCQCFSSYVQVCKILQDFQLPLWANFHFSRQSTGVIL